MYVYFDVYIKSKSYQSRVCYIIYNSRTAEQIFIILDLLDLSLLQIVRVQQLLKRRKMEEKKNMTRINFLIR